MDETRQWTQELLQVVDQTFGLYLDATAGIDSFRGAIERMALTPGTTDENRFTFGVGDPNLPSARALHSTKFGELKRRLQRDADDYRHIANYAVVTLYQYWEEEFRPRLAKLRGVEKNVIRSDEWGDLRWIRISVIHNRGIAVSEVEKMKVFRWFSAGQLIQIRQEQFRDMMDLLRAAIVRLGAA